ncbi:MAG: 50S ribosomal protein L15 [Candidatus Margulisiibacteriota bacterium]|nr:ribosomal protein L15 [uncultured bacterium]OGH99641.1 MAG: 50S ribosomal protein L15 [Candidatus Margulisbacteria bacterium GWD2_39_127]OGI04626.1 MAG: 50S ribosomal protein L15 [Candidatus Margulisbacteria bacterium GWF2_38_17]OGI11842.1 MAG: 50S ribosomal protein L15 [Candidatus Margulisbacteria bacterium GWE2_39_32]PZM79784.1 MAG: 50S ribosomal protein L15 [Candidatus Margulisiibacteriota bacterium]
MVRLEDLKPAEKSKKNRKRVGRGNSSGTGGTAGRGHKGQMSRSGSSTRPGFEGGQTPLYRRVPKSRGFNNISKKDYAIVNLADLVDLPAGAEITIEYLKDIKMVNNNYKLLKILGNGEINTKLSIKAHKFSKTALEKLDKVSAKVEILK